MSYQAVNEMRADSNLVGRITACAAEQDKPTPSPGNYLAWTQANIWDVCSSPNWGTQWDAGKQVRQDEEDAWVDPGDGSAFESALPPIGADPAVIADADILAVVQPM